MLRNMSISKLIAKMAIPSIIGMLVIVIYNMADTFFVGQTHNDLMIAAVSVSTPVFMIFITLGSLIGTGAAALISQYIGRQNYQKAKQISATAIWFGIIISIILTIIITMFSKQISMFIGASDESLAYTNQYVLIIGISAGAIILGNIFGHVIRSEGSSKESMFGSLIGTFLNIFLDPIFILVLNLDVAGAAIATLISNLIACIYYFRYFSKNKKTLLSIKYQDCLISFKNLKEIFITGLPIAIVNFTNSLSILLLNQYLVEFGDQYIASMGITLKLLLLTTLLQLGLANGILPILAFSKGANLKSRFLTCLKLSTIISIILGTILTIILFFTSPILVSMFSNNETIINVASNMTRFMIISTPVIGLFFLSIASLQALGKTILAMFVSSLRQGIIFIPLLVMMASLLQIQGIIITQPISDLVSILIALPLVFLALKKGDWQ